VIVDGQIRPARVVFNEGVVTSIDASGDADHDFGGLVIMPGLVDSHVHVNDPGRSDWEGFDTATRAAAAGGTTTIVDMPLNSIPPTTSVRALEEKRRVAAGRLSVDVAFWGGLIPGSLPEMAPLSVEGVCGFKAFLVDSGAPEFPPVTVDEIAIGMRRLAEIDLPILVHAEDPATLRDPVGDPRSYRTYLDSRPVESEVRAIETVAELAGRTGASAHILHVSSGDAADEIARAPALSGETCPHYLTFSADDIEDSATPFKCAPPIRDGSHREALWDALRLGHLSMIVSDHSPAPAEVKEVESGNFLEAWGGIASLQIRLAATWHGASTRGLDLPTIARLLSTAPAGLSGLGEQKGSIQVGADADFVVFDPDGATEVREESLQHRHPLSPYEGMRLRGAVITTILRGSVIFAEGTVMGSRGRMLRRR
jgi:allantoinase